MNVRVRWRRARRMQGRTVRRTARGSVDRSAGGRAGAARGVPGCAARGDALRVAAEAARAGFGRQGTPGGEAAPTPAAGDAVSPHPSIRGLEADPRTPRPGVVSSGRSGVADGNGPCGRSKAARTSLRSGRLAFQRRRERRRRAGRLRSGQSRAGGARTGSLLQPDCLRVVRRSVPPGTMVRRPLPRVNTNV